MSATATSEVQVTVAKDVAAPKNRDVLKLKLIFFSMTLLSVIINLDGGAVPATIIHIERTFEMSTFFALLHIPHQDKHRPFFTFASATAVLFLLLQRFFFIQKIHLCLTSFVLDILHSDDVPQLRTQQ